MPEKFYEVQQNSNLSHKDGMKLGKCEINYNYNSRDTFEG